MKRVHADENAEDTRIARLVDTLAMASGADGNRALPSTIALPVDAASGVGCCCEREPKILSAYVIS